VAPSVLLLCGDVSVAFAVGSAFSAASGLVAASVMVFMFPDEASSETVVELDVQNIFFLSWCCKCALCSYWDAAPSSPFTGTAGIDGHQCIRDVLRAARPYYRFLWYFKNERPFLSSWYRDFSSCLHERDTKCVTVMVG
jgi:hypothetical protein